MLLGSVSKLATTVEALPLIIGLGRYIWDGRETILHMYGMETGFLLSILEDKHGPTTCVNDRGQLGVKSLWES